MKETLAQVIPNLFIIVLIGLMVRLIISLIKMYHSWKLESDSEDETKLKKWNLQKINLLIVLISLHIAIPDFTIYILMILQK